MPCWETGDGVQFVGASLPSGDGTSEPCGAADDSRVDHGEPEDDHYTELHEVQALWAAHNEHARS